MWVCRLNININFLNLYSLIRCYILLKYFSCESKEILYDVKLYKLLDDGLQLASSLRATSNTNMARQACRPAVNWIHVSVGHRMKPGPCPWYVWGLSLICIPRSCPCYVWGVSLFIIPHVMSLVKSPASTAILDITPLSSSKTRANRVPRLFE